MKILLAGDWQSDLYEETMCRAFLQLGHEVRRFSWHEYFRPESGPASPLRRLLNFSRRFQNRFLVGPIFRRVNRDLLETAGAFRPDMTFVYRGTHVLARTLRELKLRHPAMTLIGYNNDDPFAPGQLFGLWRHFLSAVPEYDIVAAFRQSNLEEYRRAGAKQAKLLRGSYSAERNRPLVLTPEDHAQFDCDVVFVGHCELDGRLEMLEAAASAGFKLRLFGAGNEWDHRLEKFPALRHLVPVNLVLGDDYNKAICGAKVALCFLSKLNRDTYTLRCFEIPASGTLLLSEYTDDLATLFREGVEAEFFRSADELVRKLRLYVDNEPLRKNVAAAGRQRVLADGHDVVSRAKTVLEWMREPGRAAGGKA